MKFSLIALATILPATAFGAAMPEDAADAAPTYYTGPEIPALNLEERGLEKRAVSGYVKTDGLRYRTCPRTTCTAVGQYAKGTKLSLVCYTRSNTTPVNGDKYVSLRAGRWRTELIILLLGAGPS